MLKACPTALQRPDMSAARPMPTSKARSVGGQAPEAEGLASCDGLSMGKHPPHEIQNRLQRAAAARNAAEADCAGG